MRQFSASSFSMSLFSLRQDSVGPLSLRPDSVSLFTLRPGFLSLFSIRLFSRSQYSLRPNFLRPILPETLSQQSASFSIVFARSQIFSNKDEDIDVYQSVAGSQIIPCLFYSLIAHIRMAASAQSLPPRLSAPLWLRLLVPGRLGRLTLLRIAAQNHQRVHNLYSSLNQLQFVHLDQK